MSSTNDLKERFKRLQVQGQQVPDTSTVPKSNDSTGKVELQISGQAHIHQAVMNCADSQVYDWKKAYKNKFQRPEFTETSDPVIQETQWKMQSLVESPLLMSFHYTDCLNKTLSKLNSYIVSRPSFWSQLMAGVGQVHIRSSKNKLQLWVRFSDSTGLGHKRIKSVLENEFVVNARQLKSFSIQKIEEWFEIALDVNEKPADIRDKEASV